MSVPVANELPGVDRLEQETMFEGAALENRPSRASDLVYAVSVLAIGILFFATAL